MEKQILDELKDLKAIVYKLAGISEQSNESPISIEAIEKATKEYRKLEIQRGEWLTNFELEEYFKGTSFRVGDFIREAFSFQDCIKIGRTRYYKKSSIIELAKELKSRNVDLASFMELKKSQDSFQNKIDEYLASKPKGRKPFALPDYLENINLDHLEPSVEVVRDDLKNLNDEYNKENLSKYIVLCNNYASPKIGYPYQQYFDEEIKKRCRHWCNRFNTANYALQLLTSKRYKFKPVKE